MAKRILLTGDDGYKSLGIRILIDALRSQYDLSVVGTKVQQSGVGGAINVTKKMSWGRATVDGIPAVWVAGTPADGVEFAREYFPRPFDLVISGINMGVNIGASIISSGTFGAAFKSVALGLAPHSVAVSWERTDFHQLYRTHSGREAIKHYSRYPGQSMKKLIAAAQRNKFWGATILNINLPGAPARRVQFSRLLTNIHAYWPPVVVDKQARQFSYPPGLTTKERRGIATDADGLLDGVITVTPCHADMTNYEVWKAVRSKTFSL